MSGPGGSMMRPALKKKKQKQRISINQYKKMATVIIPTPLRKFTNQTAKLQVAATTVEEVIHSITLDFPDLKKHLLDDQGKVRSFVNIFAGDDDIRDLQQENTAVNESTVVSIVPAIAGGITA
jgi:molybdopterin synthase sulfur carrier subunit